MAAGDIIGRNITLAGHGGDQISGYFAKPADGGPFGSVVVLQHIFGVDEWMVEICRRFAHHGFAAVAPNLYTRFGAIEGGAPEEIFGRLREKGGLRDDVVMGDVQGSIDYLKAQSDSNGAVGTIGFCMGGRLAYLAGCSVTGLNAVVDCWGGGVAPDPNAPSPMPMTAPVELTAQMSAPLLGIFGGDDTRPDAAEVARTEAALKAAGKSYEFHTYPGAGHAFFNWESGYYRADQALEAWPRVYEFFDRHLKTPAGVK